jgi:hypothetical protein
MRGETVSLPGSSPLVLKRSQTEEGEPVRMGFAGQQFPRALADALRLRMKRRWFRTNRSRSRYGLPKWRRRVKQVRSRELRFSTSELLRGVRVMAWLTASKTAWNLPPISARSRFQPCQCAVEVVDRRCSTQASRTRDSEISRVRAMPASLLSSTPAKASRSSRWLRKATRTGWMRRASSGSRRSSFIGDEVEQRLPRGQVWTGQRQHVAAQPSNERSNVAGQPLRLSFGLLCQRQFADKRIVRTMPAGAADPGLQLLAPRRGALGEARQRVGEALALADDVEDIAVAGRVAPSGLLPGTQAWPGIGDCMIGLQALPGGIEQMHAPRIGIAMVRRRQEITVGRFGADAGQNGRCTLEDFIVQPRANTRQVLAAVDPPGLLRGRAEHGMDGARADGCAQHITHEFDNAEIRAAARQRQRDDHLTQPSLGDRYLEQDFIVRAGGDESVIQRATSLVRLLIDEFAAHPVPRRQIADRGRSRQRLNSQFLAVTFRQSRRRANASIHLAPPLKKSGCHQPAPPASTQPPV